METLSEPEEEGAELVRERKRKRKPSLGRLLFIWNSWGVRGKIQTGRVIQPHYPKTSGNSDGHFNYSQIYERLNFQDHQWVTGVGRGEAISREGLHQHPK